MQHHVKLMMTANSGVCGRVRVGRKGGGRGEAGSAILGARAVALSLVGLNADLAALR